MILLSDFRIAPPLHQSSQSDILLWLEEAYLASRLKRFGVAGEPSRDRIRKLLERFGCSAPRITSRGHELGDFAHRNWSEMQVYRLDENPHGAALGKRMEAFEAGALRAFRQLYDDTAHPPPAEMVHVTCTGYASPSVAQLFCESRGWVRTRMTPVYHSGCYAAVPAIRVGVAAAQAPGASKHSLVDIVHTEMCSLHLDPLAQEAEQMVVHTLFGDGFVRYSVRVSDGASPGLRVVCLHEEIVPNTSHLMRWLMEPYCFRMALSRQVPEVLVQNIERFLERLCAKVGAAPDVLQGAQFALHPGGPRIIDILEDKLRLEPMQVAHSRGVLAQHGNMSSATLPHVWRNILEDKSIPSGTLIPSVAFGPGLTMAGVLLEKVGT